MVLGCALLLPAYVLGQEAPSSDERAAWDAGYRLNPGDQVFVEVLGHDDLSGSHQLDSSGRFSMPLVWRRRRERRRRGELTQAPAERVA